MKKVLVILMLFGFSLFINGYLFMKLFNWFISTTFKIDQLHFYEAMGAALFFSMITYKLPEYNKEKPDFGLIVGRLVAALVVKSTIYLSLGCLVYNLFL